MLSFKEHTESLDEQEIQQLLDEAGLDEVTDEFLEAMTMQQRMKAKQTFRKNKSKIAMGKKRAEKKLATPEKLKKRARKHARDAIEKKLLKDKDKGDLSFGARQDLEKRVDKKKGAIERIAKRLLPQLKKADREKKRGGSGPKEK